MPFFTKIKSIQNYILHFNLSYNVARDIKFGVCVQKKKSQKIVRKRNFGF